MLKKESAAENTLLCLDIGTSQVKACVFRETDEKLELKGFSSVAQGAGDIRGGAIINLEQTIANVQESVKKAENIAKISPRDLVIGLSGEMVKGMTVTLQFVRNKPKNEIDSQELKTIIYELQWQAFDIIRKQISDEMSLAEIELKLINASVVNISIDNEGLEDPIGATGKVVELEIFNCFAPIYHFGQIQNIAVELFHHELKGVFLQSYAVCHSLSLKNPLESAVVIDIGAGTTDACVLSDGRILGNRSFAFGGNTLTKRISYELSTAFEEAESIKLSYSDDNLDRQSYKVIQDTLADDLDIWTSSLEFSLNELPIKKLPQKFLLCGQASQLPEFTEFLESHDWKHHFPMDGPVEVRQLDYADILIGEIDSDEFDREYLPLMAVANTANDLLYNNSLVEEILNSIIADKGV